MDHRFRPTSGDRKKAEAGVLLKMDATLMELDSELTSGTSGFQSPTNNGIFNFDNLNRRPKLMDFSTFWW